MPGDIGYVETQNMIEDLRKQVAKLSTAAVLGAGNPTDLAPVGPWPIATKPGKNGRVICTFRCAVPFDCTKLKVVLEEYTGSGSPVTVTWRINSADIEIPSPTPPIFDFDFPIALYASRKYGCIKLVSVNANGVRTQNPETDWPDSPRNESDFLITFSLGALFNIPSDPNCGLIQGVSGGVVGGALAANGLDPNTDYKAIVSYRMWAPLDASGAAQTWGASNVDTVVIVAKSGSFVPKHIPHVLIDTDLTQVDPNSPGQPNRGYVDITQTGYIPGDQINWVANIAWIGNDKSLSTGAGCTFAAGGYSVDPSLLTGLSLTIDTTTPPYTAKAAKITLNFTQPTPPVALKNVKIFRKLSSEGSGQYVLFVDKKTLKHNELVVAGAQSFVVQEGARFKPTQTYDLQVVIAAIGNTQVTFTRTGYTTGSPDDIQSDTAVPTLATNPDTGTTGPTVRERHGKVKVFCVIPSANINTLDNYQVIMSTSNTAPAGTPTVGSEGVLEIDYGQFVVFHIPYSTVNLTSGDLWFYFRAHNEFSGGSYSLWSAATNQHGYSRPIQDFIGTGVPIWPIRLEANGTGPGSPAIANDTTHYSISASDATDYQALLTAGVVLHLDVPSLGASDTWRKATSYDGANHRFTVGVAYGSTPGNSLAYEIHRGLAFAEKSGTGHTTTTIVLSSSASGVDDFYKGYAIYAPSQPAADQVRLVASYVGSTKTATLDTAVAGALAANACAAVSQGSFGYQNINPLSGIVAGVPFRVWLNADNATNVLEVIMPTGGDAFSTTFGAVAIEGYRASNGVKRDSFLGNVSVSAQYPRAVPVAAFDWRMRLQNLYRDGGSDGWSAWTFYVQGFGSGATPAQPYSPGTFAPIMVDPFLPGSYPTTRFNVL